MTFVKGHDIKGGRPKGSKNNSTIDKLNIIDYIKKNGADKFLLEMEGLKGKEYCESFVKIMEFAFPKLARTEVTGKDGKDLIPRPILGGLTQQDAIQSNHSSEEDSGSQEEA